MEGVRKSNSWVSGGSEAGLATLISNSQWGWNKHGGGSKVAKSIIMEVGKKTST